ncbi:hypothetical protein IPF37_05180 [bacterium]|nr:MAG: hypothetical protein IPF37_05180 [bacterium]
MINKRNISVFFLFFMMTSCLFSQQAAYQFPLFSNRIKQKLQTLSRDSALRFCEKTQCFVDEVGYLITPKRALLDSAMLGHLPTLAHVLSTGLVSPNCLDGRGCFPLQEVLDGYDYGFFSHDPLPCMELLLQCGASPNGLWHDQMPLIFRAIEINNFNMVDMLLKYGADIEKLGKYGYSIIHWLMSPIQSFLKYGKDDDARRERAKIAQLLIQEYANKMHQAIDQDDDRTIKSLVRLLNSVPDNIPGRQLSDILTFVLACRNEQGISLQKRVEAYFVEKKDKDY